MVSVSEIFRSIQGESTYAGLPCVFVRLAGCNLNCVYCDSLYARNEPGHNLEIDEVVDEAGRLGGSLVEVTGGEPLLQRDTPALLDRLLDAGKTVLVETNGSLPLAAERGYHVIMDMKCPSSGAACSHHESNPASLTAKDQVKFVIGNREDFDWAVGEIRKHRFTERGVAVLIAPVFGACPLDSLAAWILDAGLPLRLQLQLHKLIWPDQDRGR